MLDELVLVHVVGVLGEGAVDVAARDHDELLDAVVDEGISLDTESSKLADAWRTGDMQRIEQETRRGMLADPELREMLFTRRNKDWTRQAIDLMEDGSRPFIAVGAAHMAGRDGLPALLEARGYTVTRIQ